MSERQLNKETERKKMNLIIEYVPPKAAETKEEEKNRLVRFITLFAQVGFKEISLNPNTRIKIN